jgi:hypothetical protein
MHPKMDILGKKPQKVGFFLFFENFIFLEKHFVTIYANKIKIMFNENVTDTKNDKKK